MPSNTIRSPGFELNPGGLHFLCLTMDEHFHKTIMIRMRFWSPKWGEPKYSIRVAPEPTEVLNKVGTDVSSYLSLFAPEC